MAFPTAPVNGEIATVNGIKYSYSSATNSWTRIAAGRFTAAAAASPPSNPALGDQWYNTNLDILFEYINDGTSSYWVDIVSFGQVSGNITAMADTTLQGNVVVGQGNVYSIGASNGYLNNLYSNVIVGNTISTSGNLNIAGNVIQRTAFYETYGNATNTGGNLTCNFNLGSIFNVSSITANVTANFTNVNAISNGVTGATVIINQGATPYTISNLQINGVQQTIRWIGGLGTGSAPAGLANNTDIISFSMIHLGGGTFRILGQLSSYA